MSKITMRSRVIVVMCLCALSIQAASASARRALVIGNDDYPGNELHNARNDARSVADALKLDGYETTLGLDLNRRDMITTVDRFAQDTNSGDTVVFYYAGHGLQMAGENYLVPTDFVVKSPADVKSEGVALSSVLELLSTHGATTQIIILDACRDNPFLGTRSLHGGWASIGTSAGTFIAFGTSPGSTASDDPSKPHGLFTMELLKYLTTSHLDIEQMFQQVRLDVIRQSNGEQVPWTASSLVGTFHMLPELDRNIAAVSSKLSPFPAMPATLEQARSVGAANSSTNPSAMPGLSSPVDLSSNGAVYGTSGLFQAAIAFEKGKTQIAIDTLKKVLAKDSRNGAAARLLALALQSTGQDTEAVNILSSEIAVRPKDADAMLDRCLVEAELNPASSVQDCEGAVEMNPESSDTHIALADALFTSGQVKRAYDEAAQAIQLSPTESLGFALRGRIAASQGYSSIANENYQRAVKLRLAEGR